MRPLSTNASSATRQVAFRLDWNGREPTKECTSSYYHMFDCVMFPVFHWFRDADAPVIVPTVIHLARPGRTFPLLREFALAMGPGGVVPRAWPWLSAPDRTLEEVLVLARSHNVTHVLNVPMGHAPYNFDRAFRLQFRERTYANLGPPTAPRYITFVRRGLTDCACEDRYRMNKRELNDRCDCTTSRRLTNEADVAEATRHALKRAFPHDVFRPVIFPSMLFLDQLRLLRQTSVLVSAYGASLANCLYLHDDAIVVELHATYRNERGLSDFYRYKRLCGIKTGRRWFGHAEYEPEPFPKFGTIDMESYAAFLDALVSSNATQANAAYDAVVARTVQTPSFVGPRHATA